MKVIQISVLTLILLVGNIIQACFLMDAFSEINHTKKILTKTVEECGEAWLAAPVKN